MLREPETIHVDPESELSDLLDRAADRPVVLEKNGIRFLLSREENSWPQMSEEEYQRILDETIGTLSKEEAEQMLATMYRAREEGARS
ncbi:MAG: hypothetical protein ACYDAR_18820 [Thermomicrobiales bacterium]